MEKHLLITIGEDRDALYGVRFFSCFFKEKTQTNATLVYVAPHTESAGPAGASPKSGQDRELSDPNLRKGREALEAGRRLLLDRGFPEKNITTKVMAKRFGTVRDIAIEGERGLYDAVVLGRRGYVVFEKTLASSVSRQIMDYNIGFPLWICKRPEEGRKNVLLCIDDSKPSLHIADHAGFILGGEKEHTVTLFHVDTGETRNRDAIFERARQTLLENGVSGERIRERIATSTKVAAAILEESRRGAYAAVAVGRSGSPSKGLLHKWMMGSIGMRLLESIEKAALWVSK